MAAFTLGAGLVSFVLLRKLGNEAGSTEWLESAQTRLERLRGNSAANINLPMVLTHWLPTFDPRNFRATWLNSKRVKARTDTYSENPVRNRRGAVQVSKYNYRVNGGTGPHPRLYSKYG